MTVKPEQTNEHDDKQEDVRKKRDNHCYFAGLDAERLAVVAYIAELSEGLTRNV
jgi:hypothetical protein